MFKKKIFFQLKYSNIDHFLVTDEYVKMMCSFFK